MSGGYKPHIEIEVHPALVTRPAGANEDICSTFWLIQKGTESMDYNLPISEAQELCKRFSETANQFLRDKGYLE